MDPSLPRYPIESVDNALRLLLLLADRGSLALSEVAEELGVARSTAHRLLAMLQHRRLAVQDPQLRLYQSGPALLDLALAAIRERDLRVTVRPALEQAVAEANETAHFVVRRGTEVLFLESLECDQALRAGSRSGDRLPAHCTASGQALLAALDEATLDRLYPDSKLPALTNRSIKTRAALWRRLQEVRDRGYAVNRGESESNLVAVAVAAIGNGSEPLGAITIAGPEFRMNARRVTLAARAARDAAAAIRSVR